MQKTIALLVLANALLAAALCYLVLVRPPQLRKTVELERQLYEQKKADAQKAEKRRSADADSIVVLLHETGDAFQAATNAPSRVLRLEPPQNAWHRVSVELGKLDSARTPKDFQLAWFDLCQEVKKLATSHDASLKGGVELALSVATRSKALAEKGIQDLASDNPKEVLSDVEKLLAQCQRVAIQHGVSFRP